MLKTNTLKIIQLDNITVMHWHCLWYAVSSQPATNQLTLMHTGLAPLMNYYY